ncbi:MAG TPA: hypothetical protein VGQ99_24085 [Tepidisphaeraceae bacterium]|nr:hypothetical protein [Tepidisphaeraceae bacterium]
MNHLLVASILLISPLAFAADPPKPTDNPSPQQQPAPQQPAPQQPAPRPQQPQRPFGRFGQGQFGQRDAFVEALAALGDLALTPDFTITNEQKESIQSLRVDHKMATDKWRGDHHDDIQKLTDEAQAAGDAGDREKMRDIFQKRRTLMQSGPKPEDAVKKLVGLLNEEQRKRLDERLAQRRAEEEQARQ